MNLKTQVKYNLKEGTFHIISDVKKKQIKEIIGETLRAQMDAGSDTRKPEERAIYTILIDLELKGDIFNVSSDTGNKNLTAGILMKLLQEYSKESSDKVFYD